MTEDILDDSLVVRGAIGHRDIFGMSLAAFFCSFRYLGNLILKAYDPAKQIFGRDGSPSPQSKTDASETRPYRSATDPVECAELRADLNGLTENKFAYLLANFPLVPEPVKDAARNAYRNVERGWIE